MKPCGLAVKTLIEAGLRISALTETNPWSDVQRARDLPAAYESRSFSLLRSSTSPEPDEAPVVEDFLKTFAAARRAAGVLERRKRLAQYANELESLRAALPGLAAQAAIEAGELARQIAQEAERADDNADIQE